MGVSKCKICGARSRIRSTRNYSRYTQIYRVCIGCGFAWTTYEIESGAFKSVMKASDFTLKLLSEVNQDA
jgi:hypothetical protein